MSTYLPRMSRTVLFLAAHPRSTSALDLRQEFQDFQRTLENAGFTCKSRLVATPAAAQSALREYQPWLAHFAAHGEDGRLLLEDEQREAHPASGEALAELFRLAGDGLHCVVFNACDSLALADAAAAHVPFAIGMAGQISDRAALLFSQTFYQVVAEDKTIPEAFEWACNRLHLENLEYRAPRLYQSDARRPAASFDARALRAPGGTLKPTDPYYLERPADATLRDLAQHSGETIVIKAPRQMGKSSLAQRWLAACREAGKRLVFIDLSQFSAEDMAKYPRFLSGVACAFARALRLSAPEIQKQQDLLWWLEDHALGEPLAIAFDETDRLLGRPYQADFFTLLRYWHNARADASGPWQDTDLALAISTEPYLLIKDADRSPFNVGLTVELGAFSLALCQELNRRYASALNPAELERLYGLLNGHPYLTRLAYFRLLGAERLGFSELMNTAADERGPFGDHLRALLAKLRQQPELLPALKSAIRHDEIKNPDHFYRLHGAGLVRRDNGRVTAANRLYELFFSGV